MHRDIRIIIPAGGNGRRLGKRKQFELLGNKSLFVFTLERLLCAIGQTTLDGNEYAVKKVVVSVPEDEMGHASALVESDFDRDRFPGIEIAIVSGGGERSVSVQRAFDALEACEGDMILVHDACRPFPNAQLLHDLFVAFEKPGMGCVIPRLPVTDTLKKWIPGEQPWVREKFQTVPREEFFTVQTPQLLHYHVANQVYHFKAYAFVRATDDASIAEGMGFQVSSVLGSPWNIKITSVEDMTLAQYILLGESAHNTTD